MKKKMYLALSTILPLNGIYTTILADVKVDMMLYSIISIKTLKLLQQLTKMLKQQLLYQLFLMMQKIIGAEDAINYVTSKNLFYGTTDTEFSPNNIKC